MRQIFTPMRQIFTPMRQILTPDAPDPPVGRVRQEGHWHRA